MKFVFFILALIFAVCSFDYAVANEEDRCPTVCNLLYLPLCARDGNNVEQTFGSPCSMDATNCLEKKDFVKVRNGAC